MKKTIEILTADNGCTINIKVGNKILESRVFVGTKEDNNTGIPSKEYLNNWIKEVEADETKNKA